MTAEQIEFGEEPIRKVVVTGAESTGKTTIARQLSAHYRCPLVEEQLRLFVDRKGALPEYEDFVAIAALIAEAEASAFRAAEEAACRLVVMDTDELSLRVFWDYHFGRHPEVVRNGRVPDLYLFTSADIPWIADPGQRDGPEVRDATQPMFRSRLAIGTIPYVRISGDWELRFAAAVAATAKLLGKGTRPGSHHES